MNEPGCDTAKADTLKRLQAETAAKIERAEPVTAARRPQELSRRKKSLLEDCIKPA